jgi:hypothetical protein
MKNYISVASAVFTVVGLAHLLRALFRWPAEVAGASIPVWISWAAVVIAGSLAFYGWRSLKK